MDNSNRIVRLPELMAMVDIKSRATIYRWIRDGVIPPPLKLGPRNVGWRASTIQDFLDGCEQSNYWMNSQGSILKTQNGDHGDG